MGDLVAEAGMAHALWWEVVGKRWLQCDLFHAALSTAVWVMWESVFSAGTTSRFYEFGPFYLASAWGIVRFFIFLGSQLLYLLGKGLILQPEEVDAASLGDVLSWILHHTWWLIVGPPHDKDSSIQEAALSRRIRVTGRHLLFMLICPLSGLLAVFSLVSSMYVSLEWKVVLELSLQGAVLGLAYHLAHLYHKKAALTFPIIQRVFYFAFKLGIPGAAIRAAKVSLAALPFTQSAVLALTRDSTIGAVSMSKGRLLPFLRNQILFLLASFFTVFTWELCDHLIQVIHTKHHAFAPPLGSAAAETYPTEPLLTVMRESEDHSILQYLAYLDACIVAETNVDTWRRAALFEETGETYKTVISLCLRPIDTLTARLGSGLEGFQTDSGNVMKQMMPPGQHGHVGQGVDSKGVLDFQLCSWCARTVAALTAISRYEDRFGVAQLSGSNGAVLSSLLSCLLVVEVYLGRRSHIESSKFVGPNSIRWTMPSRGGLLEAGKKPGFLFGKNTGMHRKGHALADVLRICIYRIVTEFGDEMSVAGSAGSGSVIAEKDWMSPQKPCYGTRELLAEKLTQFLAYKAT